jgi:membrane-associated phospholipid phosphatase
MAADVIATGNHYVLDLIAGAAVAVAVGARVTPRAAARRER